jgi:hypothetical protein
MAAVSLFLFSVHDGYSLDIQGLELCLIQVQCLQAGRPELCPFLRQAQAELLL